MPDLKISELPVADPLSEEDLFLVVQSDGASPPSLTTKQFAGVDLLAFASNVNPSLSGFRLGLHPTKAAHQPQNSQYASSTDTGAETTTVPLDCWVSGTRAAVLATANGLTINTNYYLCRQSAGVYSWHTTLADAMAGTSKVNLSGNITTAILASGMESTTIYWLPHIHNKVSLYDGAAWQEFSTSGLSLALGTLTADKNYDVFVYDSSGLVLEAVAWTDNVTRATALVSQDGVLVKSGSTGKKYVGTFRTNTTTTTIDCAGGIAGLIGGRRFVWNMYNRVRRSALVYDSQSSWTYNSNTIRQARAQSGNKIEFIVGVEEVDQIDAVIKHVMTTATSARMTASFGLNSITALYAAVSGGSGPHSASTFTAADGYTSYAELNLQPPLGYSYLAWLEYCYNTTNPTTYSGSLGNSNLRASMFI